jgi:glycosyltransferase involved in cell wall biosynthesis
MIETSLQRSNGPLAAGAEATRNGPTVSVVIPTIDEARNLPHVLPRIPTWVHEVILVDGESTDGTIEIAQALRPDITVICQPRRGKGAALQAGFRAATGEVIVTLDADGSADPAEIPMFVCALVNGADFVKGSRFLQGGGTTDMELLRRAGNWGLRTVVRLAFGGRYSDLCYGFNAFWSRILPAIDGPADGFEIETMMNVRVLAAGLKVVEIPSFEAERIHGVSNLRTFRDGLRVLRVIVRERALFGRRYAPALVAPTLPVELVPLGGTDGPGQAG